MMAHDHTCILCKKSSLHLTLMIMYSYISKKSSSLQSTPLSSISWDDTVEELWFLCLLWILHKPHSGQLQSRVWGYWTKHLTNDLGCSLKWVVLVKKNLGKVIVVFSIFVVAVLHSRWLLPDLQPDFPFFVLFFKTQWRNPFVKKSSKTAVSVYLSYSQIRHTQERNYINLDPCVAKPVHYCTKLNIWSQFLWGKAAEAFLWEKETGSEYGVR